MSDQRRLAALLCIIEDMRRTLAERGWSWEQTVESVGEDVVRTAYCVVPPLPRPRSSDSDSSLDMLCGDEDPPAPE